MVSSLPVSSVRMEKEPSHMTEKMLNLTLEIIYLLTGEHYIAFKLYDGLVSPNIKNHPSPFTLQLPSRMHEKTNDKNIVEVTQKMIELLTGEVPITHQETTVEQEELYRDTMENWLLTSPDGSSNRNTPERSPHPLYSQDSTPEDQEITQEDHDAPQDNKGNSHVIIKVEDKEVSCRGEPYMGGNELHKEEEIPLEISTDGLYCQFNVKTRSGTSPHEEVDDSKEDPITSDLHPLHSTDLYDPPAHGGSFSDPSPSITFHTGYGTTKKFTCSKCGKFFTQITTLRAHKRTHAGDTTHSCPKWTSKDFISHLAHHTSEQSYSCSYCRKHFTSKSRLDRHEIIHTGYKPYSCTMCGKRFTQKANLARHERTHTGEKPFSCLECGKCFTRKATLIEHQYSHK